MTDKQLIHAVQRGDKDKLNTIIDKYYDDIYRFCVYRCSNRDDAYDLTQETFMKFIRYVDTYQYQNLKGYLLTIAMNLCKDYYRQKIQDEPEDEEIGEEDVRLKRAEEQDVWMRVLDRLSDAQKETICLHYLGGYKLREISKITGEPLSTIKSRERQAIMKLRKIKEMEDMYE